MDARQSAIFAIQFVKPILQAIIHLEIVYVTIENPAFSLFLYLTGVYFRGELKHVENQVLTNQNCRNRWYQFEYNTQF